MENSNSLTGEEKASVLLVLNEFAEEYKESNAAVRALTASVKEWLEKPVVQPEPVESTELPQILNAISEVGGEVKKIKWPGEEMARLTTRLVTTTEVLQSPREVINRHYVPKLIWITAGLFLLLGAVIAGWISTGHDLKEYKRNDLQWRYLKLKADSALLERVHSTQEKYTAERTEMLTWVEFEEDRRQKLLDKSELKGKVEKEIRELEKAKR